MHAKNRLIEDINKIVSKRIKQLQTKLIKKPTKKSNGNNRIKRKLSKKIKQEAIEPIESWTLHGLPNVFRSKYIAIKIIWTIIFLAALGGSIYFLYSTIKEYLEYNVSTVVRSIDVEEMDFPIITVCNTNRITNFYGYNYFQNVLNEYNRTIDEYINYLIKRREDSTALYDEILSGIESWIHYSDPYFYYYMIQINEREEFFNIDLTLFSLIFNNEKYKPDDLSFDWIFNPTLGQCFQLNTDSNWKIQPYKENKLELKLNYWDFYIISQLTGKNYNFFQESFYYIFVGGKKLNPFKEPKNVFKFSSQVKEAEIKISKSVFNKQKKPYSNCDFIEDDDGNFEYPSSFDRKYYEQIKSAGYEYSQSMCISFCQLDKIGSNCTLRVSSIKAPNNMDNFCPYLDKYELWNTDPIDDLYKKYFKNENVDKECAKMCPLECNTEQFDLLLTRNELRNISDYESNYLSVILYFDLAGYLNYEESPSISVYNLISNIGGSIGLLLGMSLLSIFEVLEMVILSIYLIIKHKYKSFKLNKQKTNEEIV